MKRHCQQCQKPLQRWGKTATGKQRYRCQNCSTSTVRPRKDTGRRNRLSAFVHWLTGNQTLEFLAHEQGVTVQTLLNRFSLYWQQEPKPLLPAQCQVLVLDATSVVKHLIMALIGQDGVARQPVSWGFAERESFASWFGFLRPLAETSINPSAVVTDGQRGLLKAIRLVWPNTQIQRCLIHVTRQAGLWLTQHPQTGAGQELLWLVQGLLSIRTRRQKRRWLRRFHHWCWKYDHFIKERSYHPADPKKWWYTHRRLRAVRSLLRHALPDLFRFVGHPEIPRTTNHVEGGINSRLKELLRRHRGLSSQRKRVLVSWYLALRQGQKTNTKF